MKNKAEVVELTKHGFKIYETNPSVDNGFNARKRYAKPAKIGNANIMVSPVCGEVIESGYFAFVQEKEVDNEEFIKTYIGGVKNSSGLNKAGGTILRYVHESIFGLDAKNKDTVEINWIRVQRWDSELTKPTYFRGMNDLLTKGFIFRSIDADIYFINVRYMFNGDRLILAQSYRRKAIKSQQKSDIQDEHLVKGWK